MRIVSRVALAVIVATSNAAHITAQTAPVSPSPCAPTAFRALDFWVGKWETTNARGQRGGDSHVEQVASGCGILERFAAPNGGLDGVGLHTYDATTRVWTQYWTDNRGITIVMRGWVNGSTITYEWTAPVGGKSQLQRYTLAPQPDGTVTQTGLSTADDGKTWTPSWRLTYRRAEGRGD